MAKQNTKYPYMRGINLDAETTQAVNKFMEKNGMNMKLDFSKAVRMIIREWLSK